MKTNMMCKCHKATNKSFRRGYDKIEWDDEDLEAEIDKMMSPAAWKAYNKLVKESKILLQRPDL